MATLTRSSTYPPACNHQQGPRADLVPADTVAVRRSSRQHRPRQDVEFDFTGVNDDEDEEFEVEAIVDQAGEGKDLMFEIKWVGFPSTENSWHSASQIKAQVPELVLNWALQRRERVAVARKEVTAARKQESLVAKEARRKVYVAQFESARAGKEVFHQTRGKGGNAGPHVLDYEHPRRVYPAA